MATSKEYQQALQLVKDSGRKLSYSDAVMQVRRMNAPTSTTPTTTPVQNAPVAGQAPTINQPTAQQTIPEAKAGDVVIGVNGERFIQANNKDMTKNVTGPSSIVNQSGNNLTKLQEVQATAFGKREGVMPQMLTVEQPTVQNQPTTPTTTTPTTLAQPPQKEQTTPVVNQPPTTESMFSSLVNKLEVPMEYKNSTAYRVATNRYTKANSYASMTPNELNTELTSAKLVEGSQAWEDLKSLNPKLAQDALNLRKVNGNKTNIFTTDANGNRVNNLENQFASEYEESYPDIISQLTSLYGTPSYEEMQSKINTPEVIAAQEKATAIETEMNALQTAIEAIDDEVDKELAGTGATSSRIALEKSARKEALQKQYDSKLRDYTTQYNKATNLINQNTEMFKYTQEQNKAMQEVLGNVYMTQYQNELQRQNTAQAQQFQMNMAQNQFEQNIAMKQMDYANQDYMNSQQFQQDLQKLKISNDYDMSKMGISNQMDMQKLLAQYNLTNASSIQASKIDLLSKGFTSDQVDAMIRTSTGDWKGATGTSLLSAPDGTIIPTRLSETTNQNGGKECAEYVNDITGLGLGSTYASKLAKVDKTISAPSVGNAAIWIPDPSNKTFAQYGHAGIITATDGKNVTIKSSNLAGDGAISTVTLPISEITKTGGFANASIKGASTIKPLTDQQYTQYNQATSKFVADPNVKAFESALAGGGDLIASLKSENGPGDVGAVFGFMKSLDPASVVKEGEFALAAKSAGVWEQFKNIPANKLEGTILTEEQRKAFGKLAFEYIKQKGKLYDIKYNDYTKILKNQGIPDTYYPTKMTDVISSFDGTQSSTPENLIQITKEKAIDLYNEWKSNQN